MREDEEGGEDGDAGVQPDGDEDCLPREVVGEGEEDCGGQVDVCRASGVGSHLCRRDSPRQMHPKILANRYGPGPFLALTNRKKLLPSAMNTPAITLG